MAESAVGPGTATREVLPALPYQEWRPTKETLHRYSQIIGKVALAKGIRRNHWWHMTYRLTARGWTTVPLGSAADGPVFTCEFDFFDHVLRMAGTRGIEAEIPLGGQSVASFYAESMRGLRDLGVEVTIAQPQPYKLPDHKRPFDQDEEHHHYDPAAAQRAFRVLSQVGRILEEHSAGYSGKTSPVQFFWHSFDLAVQRFSERKLTPAATVEAPTRESYSREQISAGFWYGDDDVPEPTFYSYAYPEPDGLRALPIRPAEAKWVPAGSAYYSYDAAWQSANPVESVLEFYRSVYANSAKLAGWDAPALACPGGITDPVLATPPPPWLE
ncbi:DUF5996 family protein [Nocardia crassostreae]|uniref:DUF5996 family protein n=1 Tax=Nocardia crassostreae TaxID=53428 RepID=UPI0008354764|nr:DUF5996 family protein [Nocardia crassostreae]